MVDETHIHNLQKKKSLKIQKKLPIKNFTPCWNWASIYAQLAFQAPQKYPKISQHMAMCLSKVHSQPPPHPQSPFHHFYSMPWPFF